MRRKTPYVGFLTSMKEEKLIRGLGRWDFTALVINGPFQFTRNPLYLSLTLVYSGIALLVNAFWALLMLPFVLLVMRQGVIDREECYLERKFGEEYLRYKARVRRWL